MEVMTAQDPLEPYVRNERCWCGSDRKYKRCHGRPVPNSKPGAPLPPDPDGKYYISPDVVVDANMFSGLINHATPIQVRTGPNDPAQPHELISTPAEAQLAFTTHEPELGDTPEALGGVRVQLLERIKSLPRNENPIPDNIFNAIVELGRMTIATVAQLRQSSPRPLILWNEDMSVEDFIARTFLLADHVLVRDDLFRATDVERPLTQHQLVSIAEVQLATAPLLKSGSVIPVQPGVANAAGHKQYFEEVKEAISDRDLTDWVKSQIRMEGPTARNILIFRPVDSWDEGTPSFHIHGRAETENGRLTYAGALGPYFPQADWARIREQDLNDEAASCIQLAIMRVHHASYFGAEYVSAAPFEARILQRVPSAPDRQHQAAMWADVPQLRGLPAPALAKILSHEDAVYEMRLTLRAALETARNETLGSDAVTDKVNDVQNKAKILERKAGSSSLSKLVTGGFALASLLFGVHSAGNSDAVGAAASAFLSATGSLPFDHFNKRRNATYLFTLARRERERLERSRR